MNTVRFVHPVLNEEVKSIAGWYLFSKEGTIRVGGANVLFIVGHGVVDSSCCGFGGCLFALVPGAIAALKYTLDDQGRNVSLVSPITDLLTREEIRDLLMKNEGVSQVNFQTTGLVNK